MFLTAYAYRELNSESPDCGASFTWSTKAFGPYVGWMCGWGMVIATIIVLSNLAAIAVQFFYLFLARVTGDAALAARDPRGALRHYRAAAAIRRPWPLTKRMAAALEASGDAKGAEALVLAHLAGEPNNAEAAAMLARRFAARGDRRHAEALSRHAAIHGG